MVISCVVVGCANRFKAGSGLNFHRIPIDAERRKKWLQSINRKNWTPEHSGDRVCGHHFISGSASTDPNDPDYIPHIKMGYEATSLTTPESKKDRYTRLQRRDEARFQKQLEVKEKNDAASVLVELSLNTSCNSLVQEENENVCCEPKSDPHEICVKKIVQLKQENKQLVREVTVLREELRETREKLSQVKFGDSFLAGDQRDVKTVFFTGVPNHATFLWLVQYCASALPISMLLSPASVLMLILMKLRLNLVGQDLAYRFGVSRQHVGDLLNNGLPLVANKLGFLIHWPAKDEVIHHMPSVIKNSYKQCRVIIDCCEVFIDRPSNFTARAMTWSNYKGHNTIKLLVAISPVGAVTFVSRAFGGRVSDKVITQRSGFLQLLEHGDLILADRGFLISNELAACGAQLAIPAFTRGKAQLSPREIETGRRLSRVRIHVERAIERIKNFKILSSVMKINLVPHADSIVTICSAISNLHPKLVD